MVEVSKSTEEYNGIKGLFEETMEGYIIHRLLRIQNPSLWQVFQWFVFHFIPGAAIMVKEIGEILS